MDFFPSFFGDGDPYKKFVSLLTRYKSETLYVIHQTRDYQNGLHFCDRLDQLNNYFYQLGKMDDDRHKEFYCTIAGLRLDMYDNLDYWDDYIRYFDELFESTTLTVEWLYYPEHETELQRYLIDTDQQNSTLHWLYEHDKRYQLIKTKLAKLRRDGKVGNLRHKQKSELTETEVMERFNRAMMMVQMWG